MKKYIILSIVILSIFTACKKSWLEIVPMGQMVAITTDDYDKILNDPTLYVSSRAGGLSEVQLMGDEISQEGAFYANQGSRDYRERFFEWRESLYPLPEVTSFTLRVHSVTMYEINKVIEEVMSSTGGTDERKSAILAEAKANRAWSNFMMVNMYCKPYLASTAGTDPGFPLITQADVNVKNFPRGTLKGTYDFIIKDLTEALASIPKKPIVVTRMSRPAVEGLLAKVYLFMGHYNNALPLLNAALSDVAENGQTALYDYNQAFGPDGSFLPVSPTAGPANHPGNQLNDLKEAVVSKVFYSGKYNGSYTGNDGMRLTTAAQELYSPNDLRLKLYTDRNEDNSINIAGRLRKYAVRYSRWGLQLPELYLMRAECKARTSDLTGAVADLETLRSNRMPLTDAAVPPSIAGDQNALIKFIIEERTREFAMEGYRWFDMRRLSVDPLYPGMVFTHTVYNADGSTTVFKMDQPNRLVMKFPRNLTDANPEMQDNP